MSKFKPQYARLLFIDRKVREGSYPNCSNLATEYEVSARSIARDIAYMKDMLGAPLEYDQARKGYYYLEKNYQFPDIGIRESDFFALLIAEKALAFYENTPIYDRLKSVFDRLISLLPDEMIVKTSWIDTRYSFISDSYTRIDPDIWEVLSNALRFQKTVRIAHRSPGKKTSERLVDPYHMASYRGEWYLVGFCHVKREVLKFAVSRISIAENTGKSFTMRDDFNFGEYMGPNFGIMTDAKRYNIMLRFTPECAPYVRERTWHRNQVLRDEKDGNVVLSFKTNSLMEIKRWVRSWGDGVTVIKPSSLALLVSRELSSALKKYQKK
jgi:predicted DNA-binding transcriptional regulator YafY